jgi:hypothetical protein
MAVRVEPVAIEGKYVVDVKRFHLPYAVVDDCPKCARVVRHKLSSDDYLSYPELGPFQKWMWCSGCDHEWKVKLRLDIRLEAVVDQDPPSQTTPESP